ncbi:MAG: membrane protein insertion efficiency factor YidD [Chloroflexi bacterium]|nr:membrane protein insertion efficiency factor YidD [Chloroflexota bacterium]
MKWILLRAIRGYKRVLSPVLPSACRFTPTCSAYAYEAIEVYGPARGMWMGLRRILRCHPLNPGGYDPVPPRSDV